MGDDNSSLGWTRRSHAAWLVVALYAGWGLREFLSEGLPVVFDAHSHLARAGFVARAFEAGQFPAWANDWYGGYRLLEFYSPGWYWVTAGTSLLVGDLILSTKLVVWVAQVASVLCLFAMVRRLTGRTLPALLAAALLIHSAERGVVVGILGNYPTALLYLAIPAMLWHFWKCTTGEVARMQLFAGHALLVGVMLLGHFANAVLVLPAILVFEVTRLAQAIPGNRERLVVLSVVGGSYLAAFGLAAFSLIPAMLHLDSVSLSLDRTWFDFGSPNFDSLLIAAGLMDAGYEHLFMRSHGGVWLALGVAAGVASLFPGSQRNWLPLFTGLCANLVTVVFVDERAAIGLAFFLYPLCAVAIDRVSSWIEGLGLPRARVVLPIMAIAFAVTFPVHYLTMQYTPSSKFDVYRNIPETPTRSRTFDATRTHVSLDGFYGQSSYSPLVSQRAIPFGAYPQGASLATYVRLSLASVLVEDLTSDPPTLSRDSLDVLYLDHVQFLVARGRKAVTARLEVPPGIGKVTTPGLLTLRHASPAIFSTELAALPGWVDDAGATEDPPRLLGVLKERWRQDSKGSDRPRSLDPLFRTRNHQESKALVPLLREMELNRAHSRAERIFVDEPLGSAVAPASVGVAKFAVLNHVEQPTRVQINARASRSGYLRMSYAHDPDVVVLLDGESVETTSDSLGGAIVIAFPVGEHRVEIHAPEPNLQILCLWLSGLLALVIVGLLCIALRAKCRSESP